MGKKLYVGNLSYSTTQSQLEALFRQVGEVVEATVLEDRMSGRSRGFGFVEMADDASAAKAIAQLDGKELDGRSLKVAEAQPRPRGDDRGGGRDGRDDRGSGGDRFGREGGGKRDDRGGRGSKERW